MVTADRTAAAAQPILVLECADSAARKRFGSSMTLVCNQVSYERRPVKQESAVQEMLPPMPLSLEEQLLRSVSASHNIAIPRFVPADEPTPDAIRAHHKDLAQFASVSLWLKNTGVQNGSNIKVEVSIQREDGLRVVDASDLPKKPQNRIAMLTSVSASAFFRDTNVQEFADHFVVRMTVAKIQPQDEYWTNSAFYVASASNRTLQVTAKIFADDLAKPIEVPLTLNTVVQPLDLPHDWFPEESEES